jgi:NAD+ diphosphatase
MKRASIYKRYQPAVSPGRNEGQKGYWFMFCENKLLIKIEGEKVSLPFVQDPHELQLKTLRRQYLGTLEGYPCYSAEIEAGAAAPEGMAFRDLRSLYADLDEDMFLLAGKAIQIVAWDQTHQFCGRCGHTTEALEGERAKKCPACGTISYPRLAPAVIIAVLKGDQILLTHYANLRGRWHSIIAGFVEPGETLEECVRREINEEVGITVKNIRYFGSQPWPFPNSLMIGFMAEYAGGEISVDGKEISEAGWYDAAHLPEIPPKISIARELIDAFAGNNARE